MSLYTFAGEHCGDRGQPIIERFVDTVTGLEVQVEYPHVKKVVR